MSGVKIFDARRWQWEGIGVFVAITETHGEPHPIMPDAPTFEVREIHYQLAPPSFIEIVFVRDDITRRLRFNNPTGVNLTYHTRSNYPPDSIGFYAEDVVELPAS